MHKSHLSDVLAGVKNINGDEILKVMNMPFNKCACCWDIMCIACYILAPLVYPLSQ